MAYDIFVDVDPEEFNDEGSKYKALGFDIVNPLTDKRVLLHGEVDVDLLADLIPKLKSSGLAGLSDLSQTIKVEVPPAHGVPSNPSISFLSGSDALMGLVGSQSLVGLAGGQQQPKAPDEGAKTGDDKPSDTAKVEPPKPTYIDLSKLHTKMWDKLGAKEVNKSELTTQAQASNTYFQGVTWSISPDLELLNEIEDSAARRRIAEEILRKRNGLLTYQYVLESAKASQENKRTELLGQSVEAATEIVLHARRWRALSNNALPILIGGLVASVVMIVFGFILTFDKYIDGYQLALMIFVAALFGVSPAVLLLLERPLKGIDSWTPSGKAEEEETPAAAGASTDAKPATTT
ncbi:MAG TPA: hypothetical protein VFC03_06040 [Acidimicrobiales bacterium]|nr:hypothetical protein [Acidimicrobiales bacterium]